MDFILKAPKKGSPVMKNIAPEILRQRLLIEAKYSVKVSKKTIKKFFFGLAKHLNMKVYGDPIIFSPGGEGKKINQGYDAFIPLIDSGFSLYIWSNAKFLSLVIYTCKSFEESEAIQYTHVFFKTRKMVHLKF
ncbi:MAG: hypothetical protein A3B70_08355 [Deltaproteobacteria bacterium RIFCSPHIGHO2_02_FULL_40_11]|nr:MAG: hypothetical protein A3B70_08355 [Deltaproteobacteria bacterium RIFCSPHIGHO2_02_FULL_40_11]